MERANPAAPNVAGTIGADSPPMASPEPASGTGLRTDGGRRPLSVRDGLVVVRLFAGVKDVFGEKEIRAPLEEAQDVGRLLRSICTSPDQERALYDEVHALRKDITVLVNGRRIHFLDGEETALSDGDVVSLFPPLYGG